MKKNSVKTLSKTEKLKLIKTKFNIKNIKPVNIENISYRHKLYLLAIFKVQTDENFDKILPLNNQDSMKTLSPSRDMDKNILDCLYTNEVICVDPNSNIESFQFNDKNCTEFNIKEVCWIINISDDNEKRLPLSICFREIYNDLTKYFPTSTEERNQVYYITMNLALNEVENYLQIKSNELGYHYELGSKTTMFVYQLLTYLSVSEIYNIIDKAIDKDFLFNSRSVSGLKNYGNTISSRMLELGEMVNRDEISLKKPPRSDATQRSELSRLFYELIHHGNDEGFNECPFEYWSNTLKSCYIADQE